jgi:type I restriction enzyme S subunit
MFKKQIMLMNTGTAILNFGPSHLNQMKIICPKLKEQQKISSVLSNVDDTLQKTNQIIEQTQRLKKGMMQKLLTRGIGHTKFKKTKIGEIPEEWDVKRCIEVCKEITVGIVVKPASLYVKKGIPCFRSFNIHENKIFENDLVYISDESNKLHSKSMLRTGDILVVRTGEPGTSCVVPSKFDGANCIDLLILRVKENQDNYFLSRFLNSFLSKKQILRSQVGSSQKHFNVGHARDILVLIPPLPEQKQIASILSNVDTQIQKEKLHKSNLERLKKGLMQKLLTGQIRVKIK